MYIVDFFVNLFKKKNVGTIIWLVVNSILVSFFFAVIVSVATGGQEIAIEMLIGFAVYLASIAVALSPVGEAILRIQHGCKKITDPQILSKIEPLFNEVYARAAAQNPELSSKIRLFICDDDDPNAFAVGRRTVCITSGLLSLKDNEIKGILAHEFGHLAHKDTDALLVISVGNLIVTAAMLIIKTVVKVTNWVMGFILGMVTEDGFIFGLLTSISNFIFDVVFSGMMWLWTKLGVVICMHSSRQNEYLADKYAHELGLGDELISAFYSLDGGKKRKRSLWAAITASHPETDKRIERLVSYKQTPAPSNAGEVIMLDAFSGSNDNTVIPAANDGFGKAAFSDGAFGNYVKAENPYDYSNQYSNGAQDYGRQPAGLYSNYENPYNYGKQRDVMSCSDAGGNAYTNAYENRSSRAAFAASGFILPKEEKPLYKR